MVSSSGTGNRKGRPTRKAHLHHRVTPRLYSPRPSVKPTVAEAKETSLATVLAVWAGGGILLLSVLGLYKRQWSRRITRKPKAQANEKARELE